MKYWTVLISTIVIVTVLFIVVVFEFNKDITLDYYVVTGESTHWKAKVERSTYVAWWKSNSGRLLHDSEATTKYSLVYKENPSNLEKVVYEIHFGNNKMSGGTVSQCHDGLIRGGSGGSYLPLTENENVFVVVEWNSQKERFELDKGRIK